ncbi:5'/3'-nucleotidase SurE [Emcibacter sp.]|uniref:5'/3'-nucleotidase SurE n=1 Tax=Emcibacter sp. TaxID=1979954 RepID=UPI003A91E809
MMQPDPRRILVTNDDGINAPGLEILERIAHELSDDVWTVAPEVEQSGKGHALTLTEPLRYRQISERRFAVTGTPTDCVMLATHRIIPDEKPTLLLSGINRGGNLAEDMTYSGTIAAAMEGTICGIPSIALSQDVDKRNRRNPFPVSEKYALDVVRNVIAESWEDGILINVNFPTDVSAVRGIRATHQGFRDEAELFIEERQDLRNNNYYWIGFRRAYGTPMESTDLEAMTEDYISVTPLHLDLTHYTTYNSLRKNINRDF